MACCETVEDLVAWKVQRTKKLTNRRCGLCLGIFYTICVIVAVAAIVLVVYYPGKKGWTKEHGQHTTTFKITGTANISGSSSGIWEAADLEDPPEQTDALFLGTKIQHVPNQRFRTLCYTNRSCSSDEDCKDIGLHYRKEQHHDGECMPGGYCVVHNTWCPLPDEGEGHQTNVHVRLIRDLSNIRIIIRDTVFFLKAEKNITNVVNDTNNFDCEYDKSSEIYKWCPVFTVTRILDDAGVTGAHKIGSIMKEGRKISLKFSCPQKFPCNRRYHCSPHDL